MADMGVEFQRLFLKSQEIPENADPSAFMGKTALQHNTFWIKIHNRKVPFSIPREIHRAITSLMECPRRDWVKRWLRLQAAYGTGRALDAMEMMRVLIGCCLHHWSIGMLLTCDEARVTLPIPLSAYTESVGFYCGELMDIGQSGLDEIQI
jgi:hypothetical protein